MNRPVFSILIPAYNAEAFLERAVVSACRQSATDIEINVVDDASSDNTLALARGLSAALPSVNVYSLAENSGPSVARNLAITVARGDWLVILDADDAVTTDHVDRMHSIAKQYDADIVLSNFQNFDPVSRVYGSIGLRSQHIPKVIDKYEYVKNARPFLLDEDWGLLKPMFRAKFLEINCIKYEVSSRHGEDFLLVVECLMAGAKVVICPEPTYLYSQRNSGWSRTEVNYGAVARHTKALIDDNRIASDQRMISVLRNRIRAIEAFGAQENARSLWKQKDLRHIIALCVKDRNMVRAVLKLAISKMIRIFT